MNRFFTVLFVATCLSAAGQVPDYVPTDGLVAWYNFDGNANDDSGNEQNASSSSVSYTEGPSGAPSSAAHFNGNAQIIVPHHNIWNSEEYTLSIGYTWQINPAAYPNGDSWFFSKREGSGWGSSFEHGPMGALSWSIGGNGWAIADFLPPQNEWIQMAWVFGSDSIRFYLDAELVHVVASPGPMNFNTLPISIGMRGNGWHGFTGDIDYIGYWSRQITAEEVVGLHNAVPPVAGCMEMTACNFNPDAAIDDGTCDLFTCKCLEGTVWDEELQGCMPANTADINNDGCVQLNDLLALLSAYGDCAAEEAPWQCGDPLEYQGYDYETVLIGEQCWFAENLRAENYLNGDSISTGLNNVEWQGCFDPEYCDEVPGLVGAYSIYGAAESCQSSNQSLEACDVEVSAQEFGFLYNFFAVNDERLLCPNGWKVSSDDDWMMLESFLGMSDAELEITGYRGTDQGIQLKVTTGWNWGFNGTNISGFTALPGGMRDNAGNDVESGNNARFWTNSIDSFNPQTGQVAGVWTRILGASLGQVNDGFVYRSVAGPQYGHSVRCIKDTE